MSTTKKIFWTLIAFDIFFVILHLAFGERFDLFHLDRERTFVAYYSGAKLVAVAALGVCGFLLSSGRMRLTWVVFSFLFLGLGFDEISELHENITYYAMAYGAGVIEGASFFRSPTYNWLLILMPFMILAFVFLFWFSKTIFSLTQEGYRWFITSLGMFLFALSLEFIGGIFFFSFGPLKLFVIEEFVEMIATTSMVYASILVVSSIFARQYVRR